MECLIVQTELILILSPFFPVSYVVDIIFISLTLGQYWNIPVSVTPFTGQLRSGEQAQGRFILNLTTPGSAPRSFTGWLYELTWEFEQGPCLYVGNRQAGPIYEVPEPNGPVIAELYTEYAVDSAFSEENYSFGMFDENRCSQGSGGGEIIS